MTRARVAIVAAVILVAAAAIVAAPSFGTKLGLVVVAIASIAWVILAKAGVVMNASWIVIPAIYLLDPGGVALSALGSPVPMVLLVAIVPLPFVMAAIWMHPDTRARLPLLLPLVLLVLLAGLSLMWSPEAAYGFRKLTLWILPGLLSCVAMVVLASPTRPVRWRWIAAAAFVYATVLLLIGNTALYPGRLIFFDANPIWVARAVFIGALVTLFGPVPGLVKLLLLPAMLVAGFLTDSLGPAVGLVLGLAAGGAELIRLADISRHRARLAWTALALGSLFAMTVILAVLDAAGPSQIAPIINDPNVTSRASYLGLAGQMFVAAPVFGSGLGGFAATLAVDLYPHNLVAEVTSELGLLGLGLLITWLILALRGAAGSPLLVALVVATTTFSLFSGNLAGNVEFWIFTGVAVAMTPIRQRVVYASMVPAT